MEIVYKNEKTLFVIIAIISTVFWIAVIVGTFGLALIYLLLVYLVFLIVHSGFISHLKGVGVRITKSQYPDLYKRLVYCAETAGLEKLPEIYLLRTDFFNALATRFLGRHFIVLFTDVVDALEDQPGALNFYIGHEIGHIHRKHLRWMGFLSPGMFLPLLGPAYRRAEEYTCDRYGAVCCETDGDVSVAIAAIAAGNTRWKSINTDAYLEQIETTSEFWMSFNELTSDYPWLTKRMATALAFRRNEEINHPRRSIFAWVLSAFIPRFGANGAMSLLLTIMMISVLAAIAIPAYQDYIQRASNVLAYQAALPMQDDVTEYAQEHQAWPVSLIDLGYESESLTGADGNYEISIYEGGIIGVDVGVDTDGDTMYLVLEPVTAEDSTSWVCYGENISVAQLPEVCR